MAHTATLPSIDLTDELRARKVCTAADADRLSPSSEVHISDARIAARGAVQVCRGFGGPAACPVAALCAELQTSRTAGISVVAGIIMNDGVPEIRTAGDRTQVIKIARYLGRSGRRSTPVTQSIIATATRLLASAN